MELTKKLIEELIVNYATTRTPVSNTSIELFLEICEVQMALAVFHEEHLDYSTTLLHDFRKIDSIAELLKFLSDEFDFGKNISVMLFIIT